MFTSTPQREGEIRIPLNAGMKGSEECIQKTNTSRRQFWKGDWMELCSTIGVLLIRDVSGFGLKNLPGKSVRYRTDPIASSIIKKSCVLKVVSISRGSVYAGTEIVGGFC